MDSLATTQRRLRRLLAAPDGVAATLAAAGDPDGGSLLGWVRGDEAATAVMRLEVYANAYFGRIRDALAQDFGALAYALGEAGFHDLVTAYLLVHPPRHPSLRHAGARLADFLAEGPEAGPFRRRWPFAADLARLETALADAFDAEDADALDGSRLAGIPAGNWEELRLELHPSVRIVPVRHGVEGLRATFEAGGPRGGGAPVRPGTLVAWRRRERAFFRRLAADEAEALCAVRAGERFGELCARLARRQGRDRAPRRAAELLAGWLREAMLAGGSAR